MDCNKRNITHDEVCDKSLNAARAVNKMDRSAGNEKGAENSWRHRKSTSLAPLSSENIKIDLRGKKSQYMY
jgi:hypothetical protein